MKKLFKWFKRKVLRIHSPSEAFYEANHTSVEEYYKYCLSRVNAIIEEVENES